MSLSPLDLVWLTLNSLRSNPLRSTLTTVGVFMGVAAVSATLQVGEISRATIARRLEERTAPAITVWAWNALQADDVTFFHQRLPNLQAVSAENWGGGGAAIFLDRSAESYTIGVTPEWIDTTGLRIVQGRFITETDYTHYRTSAVIDQFLASQLFREENPLGQRIYFSNRPYTVVGVIESKLASEEEPTGQLLIPLTTLSALTGRRNVSGITLRPAYLEELRSLQSQAEDLLKQRYPDVRYAHVYNNVDDVLEQQQTLELASQGLLVVGAIALLIGGVGIANISIAAVMERTPEIGLRLAIGATQSDVMLQFILEAVLLSLIGGTMAIGSVHGLAVLIAQRFDLPYQFESRIAALSLSSAIFVGVGASFFPALQASQLDPVKALRSQ
ncbi:ABC transporter permease [Desertifilum sp. FACHB-1129]|uniref:Macrolide ABC transporter ATP-binding protein n=1 Tax=Desertifilum tharense IPPAS B-1220 TaxID=1781255 RepID=A0A1E5QMD9_9CYAN|nr:MULTISPECIES: ABC transporter permease [Desertifilum]MDA0213343.1 ABC transporter permease [Cyanobacteria bacterium FC1]MBD2313720.1 ABC transporter permease [Desertifilum sp. FACHB-1129]MBD2325014.1 ABC transporter permease [Desertifilum sp. FACHB-866]MBD2335153.1 ABC transporter permease [Desertifilum sp. FACHB-868]OEJ75747.1 macrolide ABC transporter ATP-binding protein [Desertifilum tharense IPPAS B-1220]